MITHMSEDDQKIAHSLPKTNGYCYLLFIPLLQRQSAKNVLGPFPTLGCIQKYFEDRASSPIVVQGLVVPATRSCLHIDTEKRGNMRFRSVLRRFGAATRIGGLLTFGTYSQSVIPQFRKIIGIFIGAFILNMFEVSVATVAKHLVTTVKDYAMFADLVMLLEIYQYFFQPVYQLLLVLTVFEVCMLALTLDTFNTVRSHYVNFNRWVRGQLGLNDTSVGFPFDARPTYTTTAYTFRGHQ